MNQIPELQQLLAEVESKYARRIATTTDFEMLSNVMEYEQGESLGASTLKRLWGYIPGRTTPRLSTLNVLAKYVGYKDFLQFRDSLYADDTSGFSPSRTFVAADDMTPGEKLVIGWAPNRLLTLEYLGEDRFRVLETANSKLREGDEFCQQVFFKGWPLFVSGISRDGKVTPPYVAGKTQGLNCLELVKP